GRHVQEHAPQPIVGNGGQEIGLDAKPRAAKSRRNGIAAEGYSIIACDVLFVAGRNSVGQERDVNIGLADEQGVHDEPLSGMRAPEDKVHSHRVAVPQVSRLWPETLALRLLRMIPS